MNEFQAPPPFAQMMLKPGLGEVCPLDSFPCMGLVVGTPLRVPLLPSGILLRGAGVGDPGSHPAFSEVGVRMRVARMGEGVVLLQGFTSFPQEEKQHWVGPR